MGSFEEGIACFRDGRVGEGIGLLQRACAEDPANTEALGHLAWALFSTGRREEAVAAYGRIMSLEPSNPEPQFRIMHIELEESGFSDARFERMRRYARESRLGSPIWVTLMDIDRRFNQGRRAVELDGEAGCLFPDDPHFSRKSPLSMRIARRMGGKFLARQLVRSKTLRRLMLEEYSSQETLVQSALLEAYETGSVEATFPHSPPEMEPENFDAYIEKSDTPWWHWFRENAPVSKGGGGRLLDVGAGAGFIGHHFRHLGYDVTAASGSDAELRQCEARGMTPLKCEMHSLPVPDESFDAVLASHVLEHSIIPYVLLLEIRRVLKRGGLFYVNVPYPIEGNAAVRFPESYDAEKDTCFFELDPESGHVRIPSMSYYSYGVEKHIFVLTYWQWRWLFKLTGFEHHASVIELMEPKRLLAPEELESGDYREAVKNQLFILRKPRGA